jgi:hypothetical protein
MIPQSQKNTLGVCFTEPNTDGHDETMPRFAVLRLCNLNRVVVKEPNEPCIFILHLTEPLTDTQLRRLAIAAPWSPVMIEAALGAWNAAQNTFGAEIQAIETSPKLVPPLKPRRKCEARKQHCRFLQM